MERMFARQPDISIGGAPKGGTPMLLDAVRGCTDVFDNVSESEFSFQRPQNGSETRQRVRNVRPNARCKAGRIGILGITCSCALGRRRGSDPILITTYDVALWSEPVVDSQRQTILDHKFGIGRLERLQVGFDGLLQQLPRASAQRSCQRAGDLRWRRGGNDHILRRCVWLLSGRRDWGGSPGQNTPSPSLPFT
jgi:hypothetical protein